MYSFCHQKNVFWKPLSNVCDDVKVVASLWIFSGSFSSLKQKWEPEFYYEKWMLTPQLSRSRAADSCYWEHPWNACILTMSSLINSLIFSFGVIHWVHGVLNTLKNKTERCMKMTSAPQRSQLNVFVLFCFEQVLGLFQIEKSPKEACFSAFCYLDIL